MSRPKIILDCDPGHDDAIALLLAGRHTDLLGVTTVTPTGKPAGASLATDGLQSASSSTTGVPRSTAVVSPVASTVMSAGAVMVGGVTSCEGTATLWMAVLADVGTSLIVIALGMTLLRGARPTTA